MHALAYDCWENGLWYITWMNIIPDTHLSVPIPYMTATYHNIPQYLDGLYGSAHVAGPCGRPIWPTLVGVCHTGQSGK